LALYHGIALYLLLTFLHRGLDKTLGEYYLINATKDYNKLREGPVLY